MKIAQRGDRTPTFYARSSNRRRQKPRLSWPENEDILLELGNNTNDKVNFSGNLKEMMAEMSK